MSHRWRLLDIKNGQYSTTMMSKTVRRDGPYDGVLLDVEALERAEKALLPPKPVKRRRALNPETKRALRKSRRARE